ncbi:DNA-binding transcriptional MerR regulator [Pullulanibacillus pueri]|uniref:DNA-binding protein n=1 Tax=Pullulanibacillus pueri TaxID=1437324 RepID=A0A8J3A198_9BACL|nr:DUF3967 domain-containing protein [Pullulanibacillus pueri]MBM7684255.1 DNA-binding transcriptional MerR regulator [Pullulanibacillus pueri]GGH89114.1 DNA-binding protein [Pullulanibacillus pueri]
MGDAIKTYSTKEVAKRLLIESVTVRKYAGMLEEKGYVFKKNDRGWRVFIEDDIRAMEHLLMMKSNGQSLEKSVDHIATLYRSHLSIAQPDMTLQADNNTLLEFIKRQEEFNQALLKRLDQRDQNLMAVLREIQEAKQKIAATKQKKWWKFWIKV